MQQTHDDYLTGGLNQPNIQELRKTLTYYFSEENLPHDKFMLEQMDVNGFIPISIISGFSKMVKLTPMLEHRERITLLSKMLREVRTVEVDEGGEKVRATAFLTVARRHALVLRDMPDGIKAEQVMNLFLSCRHCPQCSSCEPIGKNMWYVIFNTKEESLFAHQLVQNKTITNAGHVIIAFVKDLQTAAHSNVEQPLSPASPPPPTPPPAPPAAVAAPMMPQHLSSVPPMQHVYMLPPPPIIRPVQPPPLHPHAQFIPPPPTLFQPTRQHFVPQQNAMYARQTFNVLIPVTNASLFQQQLLSNSYSAGFAQTLQHVIMPQMLQQQERHNTPIFRQDIRCFTSGRLPHHYQTRHQNRIQSTRPHQQQQMRMPAIVAPPVVEVIESKQYENQNTISRIQQQNWILENNRLPQRFGVRGRRTRNLDHFGPRNINHRGNVIASVINVATQFDLRSNAFPPLRPDEEQSAIAGALSSVPISSIPLSSNPESSLPTTTVATATSSLTDATNRNSNLPETTCLLNSSSTSTKTHFQEQFKSNDATDQSANDESSTQFVTSTSFDATKNTSGATCHDVICSKEKAKPSYAQMAQRGKTTTTTTTTTDDHQQQRLDDNATVLVTNCSSNCNGSVMVSVIDEKSVPSMNHASSQSAPLVHQPVLPPHDGLMPPPHISSHPHPQPRSSLQPDERQILRGIGIDRRPFRGFGAGARTRTYYSRGHSKLSEWMS